MIGALKGIVLYVKLDYCLIETAGGVGYRVFMAGKHLAQLVQQQELRLTIHTAVREDAITLYGFPSVKEYDLFQLVLGVSGVGPRLALGIVGAMEPEEFYLAVENRDLKALTKLPGIGKKTAERLLLELKDKVGHSEEAAPEAGAPAAAGGGGAIEEAVAALQAMGYSNSEIMPILRQVPNSGQLTVQELLRQALRLFAQNK